MAENPEKKKLRVVDEEGLTEEVLRLGEASGRPEAVERILLPEVPEQTSRLEQEGGVDDFDRRSIEPDIDSIIRAGGEEESGREMEWMSSGVATPVPYGWFVLILVVILGLAATSAVLIWRSSGGEVHMAKAAAVGRLKDDDAEDAAAAALVESVEETLGRYIAAGSVDDLLPLVRDPERVRPLMDDWYARHPIESREFGGLGVFQPLDLEGRLFWLITCLVDGDDAETILMEQTEDGRVLVDWETQVCYQRISWDEFAKERPEGRELKFRVYLQPDLGGFFSHEFSDEDRWSVYRLTAKGSDDYLFGYAPKGSELDGKLIELSKANRGYPVALFLKLAIPEGLKAPRAVVIEELLSERWALVEPLTGG